MAARAPSVRSLAAGPLASRPVSQAFPSHHHHYDGDDEHRHTTRKHYERSVLEDGTVREKTVTEAIITPTQASGQQVAQARVVAAARVDPDGGAHVAVVEGGAQAGGPAKKKNKKKKKKPVEGGGLAATVEDAPDEGDDVVEVIAPHDSVSVVKALTRTDVFVAPVEPAPPAQPAPEVTVTATVRVPTPPQAVQEATPRAVPRPISVVAPTVRAVSRPATIVHTDPAPLTVFAPPSPAPSHRTHRSHHRHSHHSAAPPPPPPQQVPVFVNVTIPQAALPAAHAPEQAHVPAITAAAIEPIAPTPINPALVVPLPPTTVAATIPLPQPLALPSPVAPPVAPPSRPLSVLGSPQSVRSMRLPGILRSSKGHAGGGAADATPRVVSHTVEDIDESPLGDDLIETKVVTTTTTRRVGTPPRKTPSPTRPAVAAPTAMPSTTYDFTQYVEAVPLNQAWTVAAPAPPAAAPAPIARPASVRVGRPAIAAPRTPPLTPQDDAADKQSIPIHINVNITNPNTADNEPRALKPIPFIDYSSLIRRSPPKKERILALPPPTQTLPAPTTTMQSLSPSTNRIAPPTTIPSGPTGTMVSRPPGTVRPAPTTIMPTPGRQPPQTVMSMSMDLDRDMQGHEHLHATLRDHTGRAAGQTQGLGLDVGPTPNIMGGLSGMTHMPELPRFGSPPARKETREGKHERKMREKQARREEREREKREREPVYKPIPGAAPPPRSLRYAAPAGGAAEIERKIRERFAKKTYTRPADQPGPAPPIPTIGMPPPWLGPGGRTMPLMGQRPPSFGPPMAPWMVAPLMAGGSGMGVPAPGMMPGMGMGMGMPMGMGMGMGMPGMAGRSMPGQMGYGMMGPGGYARSAAGR